MQVALSQYLQHENLYLNLGNALQIKRDYLRQLMAKTPFRFIPSHGSYFELYRYDGYSNLSENEMALELVKEAGVAVIPTSAFYQNGTDNKVLRFCFAKKDSTLEMAVERLLNYFNA